MIETSAKRAPSDPMASTDPAIIESLPCVDWDSLDRRTAGFGDLLYQILSLSRQQFGHCVSSILDTLSLSNPRSQQAIHSLKGICLNIEARRASVFLAEMESMARQGLFHDALDLVPRLVRELSELELEIESRLETRTPPPPSATDRDRAF